MFKKLLSIILCALMLASVLSLNAFAQEVDVAQTSNSGSCGENVTYNFDFETGTLTLSGTGKMDNWSSHTNTPWYDYTSSIINVVIEDGVESIGDYAFYDCDSLMSVTIPDGVESIGNYAFYSCARLQNITIPDSVNSIGIHAFVDCTCLLIYCTEYSYAHTYVENANVAHSLIYYSGTCGENLTFTLDTRTGILIISGTGYMSNYDYSFDNFRNAPWFHDRYSIKSVIIEEGVTSVGSDAFSYCANLAYVSLPDSLTYISSEAFSECKSLQEITIPDSVEYIGIAAFGGCNDLVIYCTEGSYVQRYAKSNSLPYEIIPIPIQDFAVKIDADDFTLVIDEKVTVKFEIYPENATGVITLTTDSDIIDIDGHTITALSIGEAQVTATSDSGVVRTFTVTVAEQSKPQYSLGDVDYDGKVSVMDATLIQRHLAQLCELSEEQKLLADTDKSGNVAIIDATLIQRLLAQLIEEF